MKITPITAEELVADAKARKPFTIKRGEAPQGFLEVRHDDFTRPAYHLSCEEYQRIDGLIEGASQAETAS